MGFVVGDRGDAVELVVTGAWTAEAAAAVQSGGVDRLVLNDAHGFSEQSLAFVEGLPLRELVILDRRLSDLSAVNSLGATLQRLSVTTNPALKLDLTQLPGLRSLGASWPQVGATIDAARGVQAAFLRDYQPADLTPLAAMVDLRELVMKDRPKVKSLAGVGAFPGLRRLGVYLAQKLADIEELEARSGIEDLALEACRKVTRVDALTGCTGLRELNLSDCGDLASLRPIRDLTGLELVSMFGSTRIVDGDLGPLAELPRLQDLRMQSRRSYRPSVEKIKALLPRN